MQSLTALFHVKKGHDLDLITLDQTAPSDPDGIAYVSRQARNNGVLSFVKRLKEYKPAPAGTLSLSVGGSVCATFIQPREYYTAQNVRVLTPKAQMSDQEKLWWALCIWHNRYRFNYGRHANRTYKDLQLPNKPPAWVAQTAIPDYSEAAGMQYEAGHRSTSQLLDDWSALQSELKRRKVKPPSGEA